MAVDDFIEILKNFDAFGEKTRCFEQEAIPYYVNEFWTSKQRQSHALHEISYRACFKAQLPQFFIHYLTHENDWVYDPFMGRGTTLIQAALMGRNVAGNDINPLSQYLVWPRLHPVDYKALRKLLVDIPLTPPADYPCDLLAFFHKETLQDMIALRDWLIAHIPKASPEEQVIMRWIWMVAINRLTGHSAGFFSGRTMPPNQAVTVEKQREFNKKFSDPPKRNIKEIILKKARSLLRDGQVSKAVDMKLGTGKAWDTPWLEDSSIDLVVTSPPFLNVVNYKRDNWLRCWYAGIDAEKVDIDIPSNITQWTEQMHKTLRELSRITKPGGWIAFEVGEVRKGTVLLEQYVWQAADNLPLQKVGVMVNQQDFTKTANCWGVSNKTKGTNSNRIVLLQKK